MNMQRISKKFLVVAAAAGLSAGTVQAGPLNDVLGQLGVSNGLTQLSGALDTSGPLTQLPFGNPADLLGVTVLEQHNRGNSPMGIGASVGSGNNTGNGGLAGVGVLAGRNAGNGGQIGVGALSEGQNGAGQAISVQLLNADTALGLALGGNEVFAVPNPNGQPILDPLSGGSLNESLRALLGRSGPIVDPLADGLLMLGGQLRTSLPGALTGSPAFGVLPALPGLEGSGPIAIALLGGQNSAAQLIAAGVITGQNTGNVGPGGLAGASAISSGSSGNGGDVGVGAITGSTSGNGQVVGIAAITPENSNSGNGGTASVGVLSGNNSGTGGQLANAGVLNGNNSANGGIVNAGVLNGNDSANGGTANVGALNGSNSTNGGTVNVSVLNGPNSGQGGLIDVGVLNAPPGPPPVTPPGDLSYLASCENDRDDAERARRANADAEAAAPALTSSAAGPGLKTAFNKRVAEKRNCEDLIKRKAKQAQQTAAAPAETAMAEPVAQ